jgi:hypothetical protein
MPRKPTGKRPGRPKIPLVTPDLDEADLSKKLPPKPIDFEAVLHWMDLGATAAEIAGAFRVGTATLDRRLREQTGLGFGELKEKVSGGLKIQLRRNQFNLTKTNATMGIWLGKIWLGQKEDASELKELIVNELRAGIRHLSQEPGSKAASQSRMEIEPPLPDS